MADIADYANDLVQNYLENYWKNRTKITTKIYQYCRNCNEPTPDGLAFCDADCRDDYQKRYKED